MTNIFIFWIGDEDVKRKLLLKIEELKNDEYEYILGPTEDDHEFLLKNYQFYRDNFMSGKYAFCSDVWRIFKLYEKGGIYFDAKMLFTIENVQNFHDFLSSIKNNEFVVMSESPFYVLNGFMKFPKKCIVLQNILNYYKTNCELRTGPQVLTYWLIKNKLFSTSYKKNISLKSVKYLHCSMFDYRDNNSPIKISSSGSWHNKIAEYCQADIDRCWVPLFDFFKSRKIFLRLRVIVFRWRVFKLFSFR